MATCGYICPCCEGRTMLDDGTPCTWCQPDVKKETNPSDAEWIQSVHEGSCCGDWTDSSDQPVKDQDTLQA